MLEVKEYDIMRIQHIVTKHHISSTFELHSYAVYILTFRIVKISNHNQFGHEIYKILDYFLSNFPIPYIAINL